MIEKKLQEIGLSEKEIAVYLCIFQYQRILPARVSALTNINRPTVYSVATELIKKGLIAEDISGKTKFFVSSGEEAMNTLFESAEQRIKVAKKKIPSIIEKLRQLPKQGSYSIPKIRIIDEARLHDFFIQRSPAWAASCLERDKTWWGFQDHTLLEHYQDWPDYFWVNTSEEITLNLFTNKKPIETKVMREKSYASRRHIKYLKDNSEFTATHVVCGDYILMIITRERPNYLLEIHDRMMAENVRQLFKRMWLMS